MQCRFLWVIRLIVRCPQQMTPRNLSSITIGRLGQFRGMRKYHISRMLFIVSVTFHIMSYCTKAGKAFIQFEEAGEDTKKHSITTAHNRFHSYLDNPPFSRFRLRAQQGGASPNESSHIHARGGAFVLLSPNACVMTMTIVNLMVIHQPVNHSFKYQPWKRTMINSVRW